MYLKFTMTPIPGLVKDAYTAGSRHTAETPQLIKSNIDDIEFDFEWKASGSRVYSVIAKGSLVIKDFDSKGKPIFDHNNFHVTCSCPDGSRQREQNCIQPGKLYVCKHAKAALDSVIDTDTEKVLKELKAAKIAEHEKKRADRIEYLKRQRSEQDERLPGERERIEYGLGKRSDSEIVTMVKAGLNTVDGLEALSKLFPVEVLPPKKSLKCGRCKKNYDPQVKSDLICREKHPYNRVSTEWDGSKKSWDHCSRCDRTFNLDGFHALAKRKRYDPVEEGDYCYEATHVPEDEYNEDDDYILAQLDDSDY